MFEREPITAGELMDKQFLPKPVIVEGMLPAGTYILAGTPKIGKSFLMTQLCWSVAEGIPFLGLATRKSTVLYLALEDTQERLQSRLVRMFGTDWSGSEFHLLFQINQQGDALIQQFQDFILEHPDTRLIVIDTLQRVRESNGSPYSYSHDYETIVPLKPFADAYDVALIVVHHTRKMRTMIICLIKFLVPMACWALRMVLFFCIRAKMMCFWSRQAGMCQTSDMCCVLIRADALGI